VKKLIIWINFDFFVYEILGLTRISKNLNMTAEIA